MDVTTISVDKDAARSAWRQYADAVRGDRKRSRSKWAAEDKALADAYKALAAGLHVIDLAAAMKQTGVFDASEPAGRAHYPKLAIAHADQKWATVRMETNGSAQFVDGDDTGWNTVRGARRRVVLEPGTFPTYGWNERGRWSNRAKTMVPITPPALRPKFSLGNYHVLWEVESWTPLPPIDPMLLKYLGAGHLYSVLATWDLTDIERAVLGSVK